MNIRPKNIIVGLIIALAVIGGIAIKATIWDIYQNAVDTDRDGIPNTHDNCRDVPNSSPKDLLEMGPDCNDVEDCKEVQKTAQSFLEPGMSQLHIFCINHECVSQLDDDLDGKGNACDPMPYDTDGDGVQEINKIPNPDIDGDGYSPAEGDCMEGNWRINPAASELCDGIDNNCNSHIDEDCYGAEPRYKNDGNIFADGSGDGYDDDADGVYPKRETCPSTNPYICNCVRKGIDCDKK